MKASLVALLALAAAAFALTPQQVVVVYNADSALSQKTARHYASVRGIPDDNLVGLRGLSRRDVSRADFDSKIVEPLLSTARERNWRLPAAVSRGGRRPMYAMVLMPDLPLRVQELPGSDGKVPAPFIPQTRAAIDSELALLGTRYELKSGLNNPVYESEKRFRETPPAVLSVCRIDAPDEKTIRRMIDDPARVEKLGLWGWVVVDSGGKYPMGDKWMREVASLAQRAWQPLFHESSGKTLPHAFPMMKRVAVYFGWYANPANGPFAPSAPAAFRFEPGAVAFHLHSFSCTSLHKTDDWVPALLQRGAAVTAGNVAEPTLHASLRPDIFYNRLLRGYSVAEAGLMATPALSWQGVVMGDPLYRPFAARTVNRVPRDDSFVQWSLMAAECRGNFESMQGKLRRFLAGREGALFAEMFAWFCLENGSASHAAKYFRLALNGSTRPEDKLRTRLMYITTMYARGEEAEAKEMMRRCLDDNVKSPYHAAIDATADVVFRVERERERVEKAAREAEAKARKQAEAQASPKQQ